MRDADTLLKSFKGKGICTIARIVVFKDDLFATARPGLAVKTPAGALWRDREHLAWVDPFRKEVWEYNIQIADKFGSHGWMLWNPNHNYMIATDALKKDIRTASVGAIASNP